MSRIIKLFYDDDTYCHVPIRPIELTSKPPSSPRLHSLSSPGNKEDKVDYEKNGGSTELIFLSTYVGI